MEIGLIEILSGIALLIAACYYYLTSTFNYWKSQGIPGPKPIPLYGNIKDIMFGKMSVGDFVKQEYEKYCDEPMFGVFLMRSPILIINDPDIIKDILVKNFSSFADRGVRIFEKVEPLSANLVNLEPTRWRPLRIKQTPMFSSGKIKEMFHILIEVSGGLEKSLEKLTERNEVVECCEVTARFSTDVIGACVFGIDMAALEDDDSQFRKVGKKFIHADRWRAFKFRFKQIFPFLYNLLAPIMYDHDINDFFINSIKETMEMRRENQIRRNDFVDLLIDLKNHSDKLDFELTDTLLTAQAFAFFFAGFDTSSLTMSHALYELALNQTIQSRLREEIVDELAKNQDKLEYSSMENMKYMHKVFSETLRKYPVTTILTRQATSTYTLPQNNSIQVPKDARVWIPVYGIHRDPKIYPEPDKFDPERFSEENIGTRHPFHYLPFGAGPRNCIGARFGTYQTKVGLVTILKNYQIDVCDKTAIPYESSKRRFLLGPAAGIHLKLTRIN